MADDYGNLDKMQVVSNLVAEDLRVATTPVDIFLDVVEPIGNSGRSVDVHLYRRATAPATQVISGNVVPTYSEYDVDVDNDWVNVPLTNYNPHGFSIPETVLQRSPAKDLVAKYASARTYELGYKIAGEVISKIDSSFTQTVDLSGGGLTFANLATLVIPKCGQLGIVPKTADVVVDWETYGSLLANLPSLPGVNVSNALATGVLDDPTGVNGIAGFRRIVATNQVPSGTGGFIATRNAMALAVRPLPELNKQKSYGMSYMGSADNGLQVRIREWQNPENPSENMAIDVVWGATPFDKNALIRIIK